MKRFVDTNVFIYSAASHPRFGERARRILERIEQGEKNVLGESRLWRRAL